MTIKSDVSDRLAPWKLLDPAKRIERTAEEVVAGSKAACCILWRGLIQLDDIYQVLEVTFDLPDYLPDTAAFLLMTAEHINYEYNDVYVNKVWLGSLSSEEQYLECFAVEALRQHANTLSIIARDRIGDQFMYHTPVPVEYAQYVREGEFPNIDAISLSDAKIVYATE